MKVIGIIKNDPITGVMYGLIEIPDQDISKNKRIRDTHQAIAKIQVKHAGIIRNQRGKHK